MNYEGFIREFFGYLKSNDKKCLKLIDKNKKLVEAYFNKESDPKIIKEFVNEINYSILQNKGNFKLFEKVLKNDSFEYVYSLFKNSNILIDACKNGHEEAANWLITMDVNPYIKDKVGRSALMYAVQNKLQKVIEKYGTDFKCVMLEDSEGNNALYYAINNVSALDYLKEVDINHINHNHETVLMYFCKRNIAYAIKPLIKRKGLDVNIPDKEGKTVSMILVENLKANELDYIRQKKCNFNYINENGESVLSVLIREMYRKNHPLQSYAMFARIIICLIKAETDFNIIVDEDENTAIMAILIAHDYETFNFICRYAKNIDFQKKNRNEENATSLFLKLDLLPYLVNPMLYQDSFDFKYVDQMNGNTALILTVINKPHFLIDGLQYHYSSINDVNVHKENALIIAVKMNNYFSVELLLKKCAHVNQQDDRGNTALHYAVQMRNIPIIYELIKNEANPNIKNHEKQSAFDIAQKLGDRKIIDTILGRLSDDDFLKEKSALKKGQSIRPQEIDEYLYMNTTDFNYRFIDDDCSKQLKAEYKAYIDTMNRLKQYIDPRYKDFVDDMILFSIL
ncbi:ankyrin [Anaeromyces robustus]|uniref:Ankyrin n=1 Tax=Anaeromyces robustus TaxID=1754192 RepID=A0A1Y1XPP0_9FUNG|nr:ankyrin [Anaeromyces robustus]|eukprot:ORX87718.1 ankyrin [Anaeromyces robustus]